MAKQGFIVVDEKDWKEIPPEHRDWLVFKTLQNMDDRLRSLELWNKVLSFTGGMVGGVMATFGIKLL